jgi:hypothetical protein
MGEVIDFKAKSPFLRLVSGLPSYYPRKEYIESLQLFVMYWFDTDFVVTSIFPSETEGGRSTVYLAPLQPKCELRWPMPWWKYLIKRYLKRECVGTQVKHFCSTYVGVYEKGFNCNIVITRIPVYGEEDNEG